MGSFIDITFKAGADLSAKQYYIVELTGENTVNVANAATDKPIGVLQNDPTSGQAAVVRIYGISKVNADAAIAVNDLVGAAADGQAAVYVAGTDTTKYGLGLCTKAVSNAGEIAEILVMPGYAKLS